VALREKRLGRWREHSWEDYAAQAAAIGLGLRELGVQPRARVAVLGDNRPEWLFADLGIQGIGAVTVGVYPTSPPAEVHHVLADSGAVVAIAEDEEQVDKLLAVHERLEQLRHIVVIDPRGVSADGRTVLPLDDPEAR